MFTFCLLFTLLFRTDGKVLILGGGWAGISAAHTLHQHGVDFVIVEGQNRLGGRVRPFKFQNYTLEEGANWIQELKGNVIWGLKKKYGLDGYMIHGTEENITAFPIYDEGFRINDSSPIRKFKTALKCLNKLSTKLKKDMSVRSGLEHCNWKNKTRVEHAIEWKKIQSDYSIASSSISLKLTYPDDDATDSDYWVTDQNPNGMSSLLYKFVGDTFENSLPVLYKHYVTDIHWSNHSITLITENGTSITGDYLINTLPLGVMKRMNFHPELPREDAQTIHKYMMSNYTKLYLKFEKPFWPEVLEFLITDEISGKLIPWHNYNFALKDSNILMIIIGHRLGSMYESMPIDEVVKISMKKLRSTFSQEIPDPIDSYITQWGQNRHAYGAFSVYELGFTFGDVRIFQRPKGRMFIAGEASCYAHSGLQQGAFYSGARAASEVLRELGHQISIPATCGP